MLAESSLLTWGSPSAHHFQHLFLHIDEILSCCLSQPMKKLLFAPNTGVTEENPLEMWLMLMLILCAPLCPYFCFYYPCHYILVQQNSQACYQLTKVLAFQHALQGPEFGKLWEEALNGVMCAGSLMQKLNIYD